jgi:multidrug efflux system membrane fusion protein
MRSPRAAVAALGLLLLACGAPPPPAAGPPPVPVLVAKAVQRDIPVEIDEIGTVEAYATVAVRAQVGGVLEKVSFREGQDVRAGDVLFQLDARPYEAALQSARAALARDEAQLKTAQQNVERYRGLADKEFVTREEYDTLVTTADALDATVRADRAAVDKAAVDLEYCTLRSPISGRTGQLMVNAGNVVKANGDTPLVVINQIDPIYVAFSVPERDLPEIKARFTAGSLAVRAAADGDVSDPSVGKLTFLDNTVERSTGTVRLKATFDNARRTLWPGQFVNVQLALATHPGAVLVPSQAIQTGQSGPYAFVVKDDGTVESRPVEAGTALDGETVIRKGIAAGETVVTDGQLRLVPGARVAVRTSLDEPAAGASEAKP